MGQSANTIKFTANFFDPYWLPNLVAAIDNRSPRTIAKEMGVSHMTLYRVLNGKKPSLENFYKIMKWLNSENPRTGR